MDPPFEHLSEPPNWIKEMKTINTWCILGGHHQSDISCYKHLPESSKSATRNVNSPVCYHGCHFLYKLEWRPWHKATKLLVFALIGCSGRCSSSKYSCHTSKCFKQKKKLQTVYMRITHRPCDIVLKL